ncbi:hypothetical protein ACF0H5_000692 [Mactra antiquata]
MFKLCLVVFVVASTVYGDNICCFPNEWQATIQGLSLASSQGPDGIYGWREDIFFDTADEKIRENFMLNDKEQVSYLRLYKENVAYVFNDQKCEKYQLKDWPSVVHCIPKNAEYVSPKYRLGLSPGINVVDYAWQISGDLRIEVSVTDKCSPVFINILYSVDNDYDFILEEVQNFVPAISNRTVFDVPKICNNLSQCLVTFEYEV